MSFNGFDDLWQPKPPRLRPVPKREPGFRVRLDLQNTKPPVWRRLDLPGSLRLDQLHHVIQVTMGWSGSHLHRFGTGVRRDNTYFLSDWDVEEGETGIAEADVRVDQVLAGKGDRLWYDYDFGDGWDHQLKVEKVLTEPPKQAVCLTGRLACPPEDCGGVGGYSDLAQWVRGDYRPELRPVQFDSTREALEWLSAEWHPDQFDREDIEYINEALEDIAHPEAHATRMAKIRAFGAALDLPFSNGNEELTSGS